MQDETYQTTDAGTASEASFLDLRAKMKSLSRKQIFWWIALALEILIICILWNDVGLSIVQTLSGIGELLGHGFDLMALWEVFIIFAFSIPLLISITVIITLFIVTVIFSKSVINQYRTVLANYTLALRHSEQQRKSDFPSWISVFWMMTGLVLLFILPIVFMMLGMQGYADLLSQIQELDSNPDLVLRIGIYMIFFVCFVGLGMWYGFKIFGNALKLSKFE